MRDLLGFESLVGLIDPTNQESITQLQRILVIQTAFIGDAILGTSLLEKLHQEHPKAKIDYLVRNGNQSLFDGHPYLNEVLVWNKQQAKYSELFSVLKLVRSENYDAVFNIQRYAASGILTAFSGAKMKVGYKDNPLSFLFSKSVEHRFGNGFESVHEVDRVLDLVGEKSKRCLPRLYPTETDLNSVSEYKKKPFVTIAPASVWFTKQFPIEKWIEFVNEIPDALNVLMDGALEIINDWSFECVDAPLLEGDDPIYVDLDIVTEIDELGLNPKDSKG